MLIQYFCFPATAQRPCYGPPPPDPVQGGHAGNPAVMVLGMVRVTDHQLVEQGQRLFQLLHLLHQQGLVQGRRGLPGANFKALAKPPPSAAASKRHRPRSALPRLNHASALLGDSAMALPCAAPAATKSPAVDRTSPRYARPPQNQALKPRRPANSFSASLPYSKNTSPNNCTAWGSRESAPNRPCNYRAARSSWPDCK